MSTLNIQFQNKRRKFLKIFVFLSYRKNYIGTQTQVRICHDKLAVELLRFNCICVGKGLFYICKQQ